MVKFFDAQEDGFSLWTSEMRLVMRLQHPNIVPCLDVGFDELHELWALVFPQARGGSLRRWLAAGRRLHANQIARVLIDVASALAYAHGQGVIHRDVKPENVLAQHPGDDTPWLLTDFGAGCFLPRGQVASVLSGSLEYLAPEIHTRGVTARSDQYSLGTMGLELLLGELPGKAERPQLVRELRALGGVPAVIAVLADSEPERRFEDMFSAVTNLQQAVRVMKEQKDIVEFLRPHLEARLKLAPADIEELRTAWAQRGSFLEFLIGKGLINRTQARTIDAVFKGYADVPLEHILGRDLAMAVEPALKEATTELPILEPPADPPAVAPAPAPAPAPQGFEAVGASPGSGKRIGAAVSSARFPAARSQVAVGMRLGRYLLEEHLGDGATSTVFRSFHEMLNIPVAIKIFDRIDASSDPDAAQRFLTEAQTLVRLQHPTIVRVLDVDIYEQFPHIVMEYVGEMTLASQIHNLGQLPAQRIAQIGIAVAEALQAAARLGLLHRDVKPSNILERKDGHIKLVDFGIATRRSKEGTIADPLAARGFISGTPSYIAPEQVQSPATIDARADMYGLGATLYHAAAGRPPFVRQTIEETLNAHIHDEPVHLTQLVPGFSVHLAWAIHRLLRKTPEERFTTWGDVKDALNNSLSGGPGDEPELSVQHGAEQAQDTATEDLPAPATPLAVPGPSLGESLDASAMDTLVRAPSSTSLRVTAGSAPRALAPARPVAALPAASVTAYLRMHVLTPVATRWREMTPRLRIATSLGLCTLLLIVMLLVLTC